MFHKEDNIWQLPLGEVKKRGEVLKRRRRFVFTSDTTAEIQQETENDQFKSIDGSEIVLSPVRLEQLILICQLYPLAPDLPLMINDEVFGEMLYEVFQTHFVFNSNNFTYLQKYADNKTLHWHARRRLQAYAQFDSSKLECATEVVANVFRALYARGDDLAKLVLNRSMNDQNLCQAFATLAEIDHASSRRFVEQQAKPSDLALAAVISAYQDTDAVNGVAICARILKGDTKLIAAICKATNNESLTLENRQAATLKVIEGYIQDE